MNYYEIALEAAARALLKLPPNERAPKTEELLNRLEQLFAPEHTRSQLELALFALLMKLETEAPKEEGPLPLALLSREVWYGLERRFSGKDKPLPLPWKSLSSLLGGGLWPGLTVLVGTPGSGKSQLACQLALYAAKQGISVAYLALELGKLDITARLVGAHTGLPWSDLYLGKLPEREQIRAFAGLEEIAKLPLFLEVGNPGRWPDSRIEQAIRKVRDQRTGPLLVILDFLQLVGEKDVRADPREKIGQAAYEARRVARDLEVAILAVSSTSRANYKLGGDLLREAGLSYDETSGRGVIRFPEALLSLAKESGEIEFAVDNLLCAIRWPDPLPAKEGSRAVILAAPKLRCGEPSWCELRFNGTSFAAPGDDGLALRAALASKLNTAAPKSPSQDSNPRNGHGLRLEDE